MRRSTKPVYARSAAPPPSSVPFPGAAPVKPATAPNGTIVPFTVSESVGNRVLLAIENIKKLVESDQLTYTQGGLVLDLVVDLALPFVPHDIKRLMTEVQVTWKAESEDLDDVASMEKRRQARIAAEIKSNPGLSDDAW